MYRSMNLEDRPIDDIKARFINVIYISQRNCLPKCGTEIALKYIVYIICNIRYL